MSQVVVVATFVAREGSEEQVIAALEELVTATHAEAGCLAYAVHRDIADPRAFVLIERWTSQIALENHLLQPYVTAVGGRAAELLDAPPQVRHSTPVSLGDPVKGSL